MSDDIRSPHQDALPLLTNLTGSAGAFSILPMRGPN
jgi:hypothetical protein